MLLFKNLECESVPALIGCFACASENECLFCWASYYLSP